MKTLNNDSMKSISTFPFLSQEPQIAEAQPPQPPPQSTQLPQDLASGSPLYNENWRNPNLNSQPSSLVRVGAHPPRMQANTGIDLRSLMDLFAGLITEARWGEMKELYEVWIRSLDARGKPNKPDVNLYNQYLRANLELHANAGDMLDLVGKMEGYGIKPNTASYKLVLKAMIYANEIAVAGDLLERMIEIGKEVEDCSPDEESFDMVILAMFKKYQIYSALKFIDLTLKSGYMLSMNVFDMCIHHCTESNKLEDLTLIMEKCKNMVQNKALLPIWNKCIDLMNAAVQSDNNKLAYYALEYMSRHIVKQEKVREGTHPLPVDEGLIVSLLGTAGRTYSLSLLDGSWLFLKRSLRGKKIPNPDTYIAKIYAYASLGNLPKAFGALKEFEEAYGGMENAEDLLSPFTTLHPLVLAVSKNGFTTLDDVYFQLETLHTADDPYKSIAALNCVIVGCANTWDVDRTYQTFNAIDSEFGLTPNIHSYNGLISAFGKLRKRDEAVKIFEHFKSLGVKPDALTYSLLVDSHLLERDQKSALLTIEEMISEGFKPTKEMLKKVRRRCTREMDNQSDSLVTKLEKQFQIRVGSEFRRSMLFKLEFTVEDQSY
jgi:pentatricopeptide repeat protein